MWFSLLRGSDTINVFIKEKDIRESLNVDDYYAYKEAVAENGDLSNFSDYYGEFEDYSPTISYKTTYQSVVDFAKSTLGLKDATFAQAMSTISNSVADVTAILRVLIYPVLVLGGAANMFITVNTLPLVLDIGGIAKVGTFTGYYYTATFSAQIASPIIYGFIRMIAGTYMSLFYYSPIMFALAILLLVFVKHGEAVPDDIVKEIQEEND